MKLKNIALFLVALLSMSLVSCDQENIGTEYNLKNQGVSFLFNAYKLQAPEADPVVVVPVVRGTTKGQATVNITATIKTDGITVNVPSTVTFQDGSAKAELPINLSTIPSGKKATVVLSLDENEVSEGSVKSTTLTLSILETWTQIGTGTYHYLYWWEDEYDKGLPLYRCDQNPNKYKIGSWGIGSELIFTMDNDGNIEVLESETGDEYSSYGAVYVMETASYTGETKYGVSKFADGVYTFNLVYYVGAGTFDWGIEESFTLD